jgi:phosphatidylglycerophosphate synthase
MTNDSLPRVVILADKTESLTIVAGISLLERLLRTLQRLGFSAATVVSELPSVSAHLERRSWASADVVVAIEARVVAGDDAVLLLSGDFVYDARLLRALADSPATTVLIDSAPAGEAAALWNELERDSFGYFCRAAFVRPDAATGHLMDEAFLSDLAKGGAQFLDAAAVPRYVASMRREVRPFCFPAPSAAQRALAERVILDAAQNGTLDLPALVHAPIENWIVRCLCPTSITPNQVTFATTVIGIAVTLLYLNGYLWPGTLLALAIGILDGVDGKLARVKVETTELGRWEHETDFFVEFSWWAALAWNFSAFWIFAILLGADLIGRVAKRATKQHTGRNLDDVSAFDRLVRRVAGRRNIYVWVFAVGLSLGQARLAFATIAWWAGICTAEYCVRTLQISFRRV